MPNIFPYLLAMIVAVNIFRSAKLLDFVNNFISPVASIIGLPKEVVPLVLIKPLSGSGAMGIFTDILNNYGADSFIGLVASCNYGDNRNNFLYCNSVFWCYKNKKSASYCMGSCYGRYDSDNYGNFNGKVINMLNFPIV